MVLIYVDDGVLKSVAASVYGCGGVFEKLPPEQEDILLAEVEVFPGVSAQFYTKDGGRKLCMKLASSDRYMERMGLGEKDITAPFYFFFAGEDVTVANFREFILSISAEFVAGGTLLAVTYDFQLNEEPDESYRVAFSHLLIQGELYDTSCWRAVEVAPIKEKGPLWYHARFEPPQIPAFNTVASVPFPKFISKFSASIGLLATNPNTDMRIVAAGRPAFIFSNGLTLHLDADF